MGVRDACGGLRRGWRPTAWQLARRLSWRLAPDFPAPVAWAGAGRQRPRGVAGLVRHQPESGPHHPPAVGPRTGFDEESHAPLPPVFWSCWPTVQRWLGDCGPLLRPALGLQSSREIFGSGGQAPAGEHRRVISLNVLLSCLVTERHTKEAHLAPFYP